MSIFVAIYMKNNNIIQDAQVNTFLSVFEDAHIAEDAHEDVHLSAFTKQQQQQQLIAKMLNF